ncbi:MAG TPA: twin-arginine translocation signal domain-containing protein, partial [Anaerolineae bacterium]|nr:twin-arginine translocation signal domain-containing protein [Anaerolineae bacterium]
MKLGRRDFLKLLGLGAAGAVLAPSAALEELTHGASDLTPRERDAVAEVMGLRREQWAGHDLEDAILPSGRGSWRTVDNLRIPTLRIDALIDGKWETIQGAVSLVSPEIE